MMPPRSSRLATPFQVSSEVSFSPTRGNDLDVQLKPNKVQVQGAEDKSAKLYPC